MRPVWFLLTLVGTVGGDHTVFFRRRLHRFPPGPPAALTEGEFVSTRYFNVGGEPLQEK